MITTVKGYDRLPEREDREKLINWLAANQLRSPGWYRKDSALVDDEAKTIEIAQLIAPDVHESTEHPLRMVRAVRWTVITVPLLVPLPDELRS